MVDRTPPRPLLATARNPMRARRMSLRTEGAYLHWIRRFVEFHGRRPPQELGPVHVEAFLTDLATRRQVAASIRNQVLCSDLFLYKQVLGADFPRLESIVRDGRGRKGRITTLPENLRELIAGHLTRLREWFDNERRRSRPGVSLPFALERKYPDAATSWARSNPCAITRTRARYSEPSRSPSAKRVS